MAPSPTSTCSHPRDHAHLGQALPGQAHHQGIELRLAQRQWRAHTLAWPHEASSVQAPCGAPHAEAVVHQQLDARGARVGEQVTVVGMGGTSDLHDAGQQPLGASAHVHRYAAQPQAIDADHLSRPELNSRSQAAQSPAADIGQWTLRCSGPRRSSKWMGSWTAGLASLWRGSARDA